MNDFILPSTSTLSKIKDGSVPNDLTDDRRKKAENMPSIIHLGFVIRHDAKVTENIIAACIAQLSDKGKTAWKAYPRGDQAFIPMLFVTSVLVKQRLANLADPESGMSQGEILLKKPDPRFDFILNHLFDVWTKRASYKSLPQDLRKTMRFFFELHGQKATAQLRAPKDGLRPSQIFFWTVRDYIKQTNLQLPKAPITVSVKKVPPQSNPYIILRIPELAEKVRLYLAQPQSWQELYRKAIKAPEDLPTHKIPLCSSKIDLTEEKNTALHREQHLPLSQMMTRHRKILLTGPSGSGKTTIQKILIAELLGHDPPIKDCVPIFVSLKDIGFKEKSVTDLIVDSVVKQILTAKSLRRTIQQQVDIRRAHYGDMAKAESLFADEVREFFTSKKNGDNRIGLFLDGFNEIREAQEYNAGTEIQQLSEIVDKIVVSSHSYGAFGLLPQFTRFDLEELSNEQILDYLNRSLEGKGEEFFEHKVATNGRILSMARVPLYLELIVQYHQEYPDRRLPICSGPLLKFFVQKLYVDDEKQEVRARRFHKVTNTRINYFLRKVAYGLIDKGKEKPETVLSFPDEVKAILPELSMTELEETAKAAELFGFLEKSGQISEKPDGTGVISFRHDNIRDYFVAQYLLRQQRLSRTPQIETILEYLEWDNALEMYFGLIADSQRLREDLSTIVQYDLFLASHCLVCCPAADNAAAQFLFDIFCSNRFQRICSHLGSPPEPFSIHTSLACVLSLFDPQTLKDIYSNLSNPDYVRRPIPDALGLALGRNALPHLQSFIHKPDSSANRFVYMAIQKLAGSGTWELLTKQYIEFAQAGDPRCTELESTISSLPCRVASSLIKKQVDKARRDMAAGNCPQSSINHVVRFLSRPIAYLEQDCISDLLELEKHPDEIVSHMASEALLKNKAPKALQGAVERIRGKAGLLRSSEQHLGEDICALCSLNDPDIDSELWQQFEANLVSSSSTHGWSRVPKDLALRTESRMLMRLINLSLSFNSRCALESMYAFAYKVPDVVIEVLRKITSTVESGMPLWQRLVVFRAYCGDGSMADELLDILGDINSLQWVMNPQCHKFELDTWYANMWFQTLAVLAANKLDLCQAVPLLRNIPKGDGLNLAHTMAQDVTNWLLFRHSTTKQQISELVTMLREQCEESPCIPALDELAISALHVWPPELLEFFLREFRDNIEIAINENRSSAPTLYHFLALLRRIIRKRHLNIFKGWPCFPPADRNATPSSKTKKTGFKRSSKP